MRTACSACTPAGESMSKGRVYARREPLAELTCGTSLGETSSNSGNNATWLGSRRARCTSGSKEETGRQRDLSLRFRDVESFSAKKLHDG
eukprot:5578406-Pleurochrysis_carterae.AAC.1